MTEQEYLAEKNWLENQERHFDYLEGCVFNSMFCDENMEFIRKGFDIVCAVESGAMLAADCIMATINNGDAKEYAKAYQAKHGNIHNLVVVYADGDMACEWLIVNEGDFN